MTARPATRADVPALTELWRAVDTHWFDAAEHDELEVGEELDLLDDLAHDTRLVYDGDRLVCAALRGRHESFVLTRPDVGPGALHADALHWLASGGATRVEVLDRDSAMHRALEEQSWQYSYSSFELTRALSRDRPLPEPVWPGGVTPSAAGADDVADLHRLIYTEARFADIPGHAPRDLDDWQRTFLGDRSLGESVVLARRGGRMVGASLVRVFSDGTGWISQLAVAPDERGHGLGRALALESFDRLVTAGANALGLGVMAANQGALRLYVGLGLTVEREWQLWDRVGPGRTDDATFGR